MLSKLPQTTVENPQLKYSPSISQIGTYTDTDKHPHTHTHKQTHKQTHTHTHTHTHTQTNIHKQTHTNV